MGAGHGDKFVNRRQGVRNYRTVLRWTALATRNQVEWGADT